MELAGKNRCTLGLVPIRAFGRPRCTDPRLRGALLLPLGVLAVHQLRFQLAFGSAAGSRLAREGHGYLATFEPFALLAAAIAAGAFIGRLARAWQTGDGAPDGVHKRHPVLRSWALCATALLAAYCAQELLEGIFAAGHPGGLAGVFGAGGWLAVPLAGLAGAALASALRVADTLIQAAAAASRTARPTAIAYDSRRPEPAPISDWRLDPGCGIAAGRAPPTASSFT
jgi:hypothetical protein